MVTKTIHQDQVLDDAVSQVREAEKVVSNQAWKTTSNEAKVFTQSLNYHLQLCFQLASEKGASSWLSCRPLKAHGFNLSKAEFHDGLVLRYGWQPARMPSTCSCGASFTIGHALSCYSGGFPSLRHNEESDVTAGLLKQVATNVTIKSIFSPSPERSSITVPQSLTNKPVWMLQLMAYGVGGLTAHS